MSSNQNLISGGGGGGGGGRELVASGFQGFEGGGSNDSMFEVRVYDWGKQPYDPDLLRGNIGGGVTFDNMRRLDVEYTLGFDIPGNTGTASSNPGDYFVYFNLYADTSDTPDYVGGVLDELRDRLVSFVADRTGTPEAVVEQMIGDTTVLNGITSFDPGFSDRWLGTNINTGAGAGHDPDSVYDEDNGRWEWTVTKTIYVPIVKIPYHPDMQMGAFLQEQFPDIPAPQMEFKLHQEHSAVRRNPYVIHNTTPWPFRVRIPIDKDWFFEFEDVGDQYCFMSMGEDWSQANTLSGRLENLIEGVPTGVMPGPGAEIPTTVGQASSDIAQIRSELANNIKAGTDNIQNAESLRELAPDPSEISIPEVMGGDVSSSIQSGEIPEQVGSVEEQIEAVRQQVDQAISDLSTGEVLENANGEHISAILDQNTIENWVSRVEDAVDSLQSAQEYRNQLQNALDGLDESSGFGPCIDQIVERAQEVIDQLQQEVPNISGKLGDGRQILSMLGGDLPEPPSPPEPTIDCVESYPDIVSSIEELRETPDQIRDRQITRREVLNTISEARSNMEQTVQENQCLQEFTPEIDSIESEVREFDPTVVCEDKYSDIYSRVQDFDNAASRIESGQVSRGDILQQLSDLRGRVGQEVEEPRCGSKIRARIDDAEASIAEAELECDEAYAGLISSISNFEASVEQFVSFNPIQRSAPRRATLVSEGRSILDEIDSRDIQSPCDSQFRSRVRDSIASLQGLRVIAEERLPCSSRFEDIDERVSEIERIAENISPNNPEQDMEAILTRVESLREDIQDVEDRECVEQFTRRISIATRDLESIGQSIRVDENIVNELQVRRSEMIEDFRARYEDL